MPPAPSPSYDPRAAFLDNVKTATKFSAHGNPVRASCGQAGRYDVKGADAAIVRYTCKHELVGDPEGVALLIALRDSAGVRLVGNEPGSVVEEEWNDVEVVWSSRGGFFELFDDGRRFVVLRTYDISLTDEDLGHRVVVYGWNGQRFVKESRVLPYVPHPAGEIDVDKDGRLELLVRMWTGRIPATLVDGCAPAQRAGWLEIPTEHTVDGPRDFLRIDGLVARSGSTYSRTLTLFRPWYAARLRAARATLASLAGGSGDAGEGDAGASCALTRWRAAAETYAFGRVLGEDESALVTEAEAAVDPKQLEDFRAMRKDMAAEGFPALTDARLK